MPALSVHFPTSGGFAWVLKGQVLAHGAAAPDPTTRSDEALMDQYRAGDACAFDELYRRHRNGLYRFVVQMTKNRADADEIFQDAWIAVIRGAARYTPTARFVTYLFAIAHRRAADGRRRSLRWPLQPIENPDDIASPEQGPLSAAANAQLADALRAAIAALPPRAIDETILRCARSQMEKKPAAWFGMAAAAIVLGLFLAWRSIPMAGPVPVRPEGHVAYGYNEGRAAAYLMGEKFYGGPFPETAGGLLTTGAPVPSPSPMSQQ